MAGTGVDDVPAEAAADAPARGHDGLGAAVGFTLGVAHEAMAPSPLGSPGPGVVHGDEATDVHRPFGLSGQLLRAIFVPMLSGHGGQTGHHGSVA
ncbi:MAG TPA: hypothetical protein VMS00_10320 [Acidimicrobiales bacterium]|nr:hypothetical protein [Acidimicrobiales bacterium]